MKASWESTVNFINKEATKRTKVISDNAQWFEDHSPVDKRFKKEKVKGVSAKVITVSMLGGDCYPATPIGINLPNADWIRRDHGSKSVTIENITEAYDKASQGNGFNDEFVWSDKEREGLKKYGFITNNLHTDLHECLGHGSGKLLPDTDPDQLCHQAIHYIFIVFSLISLCIRHKSEFHQLGISEIVQTEKIGTRLFQSRTVRNFVGGSAAYQE